MSTEKQNYRELLSELDAPIYDLCDMQNIVWTLWLEHRRLAVDEGDGVISVHMDHGDQGSFDFAIKNVLDRLNALKEQWNAAVGAKVAKS